MRQKIGDAMPDFIGRPPAVVLAGGQARRMGGGDKPLRLLNGRPLLDHVLDRLRPQAGPIALSANGEPARFASWGLPVLGDTVPGQPGPLAGVLAAMRWARTLAPVVLTVPGDAPLLPADLLAQLLAAWDAGGSRIVYAASRGRAHPVIALWSVSLADALEAALARGDLRVGRFAAAHAAVAVAFETDGADPFANINTPDDLAQAETIVTKTIGSNPAMR